MLRVGTDLIEVPRIAETLERFGERFLKRCFTPAEQAAAGGQTASLAARFAAKEAVAKALGCGIGDVSWLEIEIVSAANRQPELRLHGNAARLAAELGLRQWAVSLSHTHTQALAFVVASY